MAGPQYLLGKNGLLLLVGGKPLKHVAASAPTLTIPLVAWFMITESGYTTRFNIPTTASSGDTTANVPIVFSYTGGQPTSVQARIVDANGSAVTGFDWTDITSTVQYNSAAGTGLGYLYGVPKGIGYKRQIRVGTSATVTSADATPFNIGPMINFWGQSNANGTLNGGYNATATIPGTSTSELTFFNTNGTGALFGPNGFNRAGNNNATIASFNLMGGGACTLLRLVGNQLQAQAGRKVGVALTPYVQDATPMTGFMTSAGVIAMLSNSGTSGASIGFSSPAQYITGDYRVVLWHQGESEASPTRASRLADLKKFCQAHIDQVAKFGRQPSQITFLFALMGVCAPQSNGNVSAPHMELLRAAVLDLVAYATTVGWDVRVGWNCIDLDPATAGDAAGLHFGGTDRKRSLLRAVQSILNVVDPVNVPNSGKGPRLTGAATRSGDDITLTVAHDGGTGLAARTPGSPITGWYANTAADFSGTDIPLTNVTIVDATHIRVTATGAPATFYIKHCGYQFVGQYTLNSYHPTVSNLVYDNFAYPSTAGVAEQFTEGLPLWPTPDAIRIG